MISVNEIDKCYVNNLNVEVMFLFIHLLLIFCDDFIGYTESDGEGIACVKRFQKVYTRYYKTLKQEVRYLR